MLYRDSVQISVTTCCLHGSILPSMESYNPQKKTWFSMYWSPCCWTKPGVRGGFCVNLVVDFNHSSWDFSSAMLPTTGVLRSVTSWLQEDIPPTFVGCMLERCEGQQIQNKVAKVKRTQGWNHSRIQWQERKTQELRDWTSDCVYETAGSSLFFFPWR